MNLYTIGFTKTSAAGFFARLKTARVKRLIDVRLHNTSQLAGFAKQDDLCYFARALCGIGYDHKRELAPTEAMLRSYKESRDWDVYARTFTALMARRNIERLDRAAFNDGCLLCSETKPHHCHRRLVAEYLQRHWRGVHIVHL